MEYVLGELTYTSYMIHTDTKKDFENHVQTMLYGMANHTVTLDRFVSEYEKHSGVKLTSFYGHPKLIKLLEDIPQTVMVRFICTPSVHARGIV